MNILITSEFYYPHIGGAEKVVQVLAEGLVKRGHQVTVATTKHPNRELELAGVKIVEFDISGNAAKSIKEKTKGDIAAYKNLLINGGFETIVQYAAQTWHTDLAFNYLNEIKAKKILVPCGFSGLTTWLRRILYRNYFKKMPQHLVKYDELVFLSENYLDTQFAIKHGINKYTIIPNGIYTHEFDSCQVSFREKYNIPSNKKVILNVSNHYKLKGHKELIESFLKSNISDSVLVIIGNDPGGRTSCANNCHEMAKNNKNIYLLSGVPREYVVSAYKESDLFVLSSYIEYYPLVLIEAMYCSKPILSMDVGCVKDYCECILIDNYNQLSNGIITAFENYPAGKIEENYHKVVNQLTWEKIVDNYNDLIAK